MNDDAHARLLDMLAKQKFEGVSRAVSDELLHFFSDPQISYPTKSDAKVLARVRRQLDQLKATPLAEIPARK